MNSPKRLPGWRLYQMFWLPATSEHDFIYSQGVKRCMENNVDPDQLASEEANWSGYTFVFSTEYICGE